ncbi:hypothetical protein SI859A1_01702 [Aurantimonas manganoxydans SI85-9A1]|uniref:DUF4864 domain-containing protein n=3 Tax=Aurantimonas manganoxydans TaxID=651183 RepID=Q1YHY2_AURMS|nr:hypothetical protein SI859A1_01702 [Aurantimonas manganoxydans SI85-9A1]
MRGGRFPLAAFAPILSVKRKECRMRRRMMSAAAAALVWTTALAAPAVASDADDIRATIGAQLDAFRAGDGAEAYSHAAPNVRALFPSPQSFMAMVKQGYDPVYRSQSAVFGALKPEGASFRQEVNLTDSRGRSWVASYTLERQADGTMKITGCTIRKGDDLAV